MATPTFSEWRNLTTMAKKIKPTDITTRMVWCLATMVTQTNPDGTPKGS